MDQLNRDGAFVALWAVFLLSTTSKAENLCGQCMSNLAYCINETSYHVCPNGKNPLLETVHQCASDEVCTSTEVICMERSQTSPGIIPCIDECNVCPASAEPNNKFSCISKTQYVLCNNGDLTDIVGSCSPGEYCNVQLYRKQGRICAPDCVLNFFDYKSTCENEIATSTIPPSTPTVPTPQPNLDSLRVQCENSIPNPYNGYFYIKNQDDPNCKTYIYCEIISNEINFILLHCNEKFYDEETNTCIEKQPESCIENPNVEEYN